MSLFGVLPGKESALAERMKKAGVFEKDLVEKFVRSQGPGGQHLNKTSTCVFLKHVPTGIGVKMQENRSQGINRFLARRALVEKIEREVLGIKTKERLKVEKIKKQKKRRSRRTIRRLHEAKNNF